jgi:tetratricopeptide (TPR) repeat protein
MIPELPAELDAVVFRAMARDPANRYEAARDMETDLRRLSSHVMEASTASQFGLGRFALTRRPVMATTAALAVLLALGALGVSSRGRLHSFGGGGPAPPGPHVVAVLPLLDPSKDPQNEALTAGVADSLITALSKLDGVTVVSRAAMLKHRDRKLDPDAIAHEVGASLLVDGSLQRSGDALRLTLSLLQPGSNVVQWQESYDGDFKDVLHLQRDVATAVAQTLRVKLTPEARARLQQNPTENVEALADYSQARALSERVDVPGNTDRSIVLFKSAISKDPRFARAYGGLGESYWWRYQQTGDGRLLELARTAIMDGLRLDPQDTTVRFHLATLYSGSGRRAEAIEELNEVIRSAPNNDSAHRLLGELLIESGQPALGLPHLARAIELRPAYWVNHHTLGLAHFRAGRYADAVKSFTRMVQLQPDSAWGYQTLGTAYQAMDDTKSAIANYSKAIEYGSAKAYTNLGLIHYEDGNLTEAQRCFEEALKREPNCAKHQALGDVHLRAGRQNDAIAEYRTARDLCLKEMATTPRDAVVKSRLALLEAKLGRPGAGLPHLRAALDAASGDPEIRYTEAVFLHLAGDERGALTALQKALASGFSRRRALQDPFLESLRKDPRFLTMVAPGTTPSTSGGS